MSQITDDLGRGVALPAGGVRRIVSLSPAATENLYALEAGGLLVGGTTADDYPPARRPPAACRGISTSRLSSVSAPCARIW